MNLKEIRKKFNSSSDCLNYIENLRWGKTITCSYCASERNIRSKNEPGRHFCYNCKRSFTVFVGTIFEDTRLDLNKWFLIAGIMISREEELTAKEMADISGVTLKTAWLTMMKIRCIMVEEEPAMSRLMKTSSKLLKQISNGDTYTINLPNILSMAMIQNSSAPETRQGRIRQQLGRQIMILLNKNHHNGMNGNGNGIRKQVVSNKHYLPLYQAEKDYLNKKRKGKDSLQKLLRAAFIFS
jgi:transposase-like protein